MLLLTLTMRKLRNILWYGRVHFHDEAPRLGCGVRGVELIRLGWKWALIRERSTGLAVRVGRKVWDQIAPKEARDATSNGLEHKRSRKTETPKATRRKIRKPGL